MEDALGARPLKFSTALGGHLEGRALVLKRACCCPIPPPFCFLAGPCFCFADLALGDSKGAVEAWWNGTNIKRAGPCAPQFLMLPHRKHEINEIVKFQNCGLCPPSFESCQFELNEDGTISDDACPHLVLGLDDAGSLVLVDRSDVNRVLIFEDLRLSSKERFAQHNASEQDLNSPEQHVMQDPPRSGRSKTQGGSPEQQVMQSPAKHQSAKQAMPDFAAGPLRAVQALEQTSLFNFALTYKIEGAAPGTFYMAWDGALSFYNDQRRTPESMFASAELEAGRCCKPTSRIVYDAQKNRIARVDNKDNKCWNCTKRYNVYNHEETHLYTVERDCKICPSCCSMPMRIVDVSTEKPACHDAEVRPGAKGADVHLPAKADANMKLAIFAAVLGAGVSSQ